MRPALGESARLYHQTPGEESRVLELQRTGFFLLLLVVLGGLLIWVVLAKQLVFRNKQLDKNIGRVTSLAEDAQVGYRFQTSVTRVPVSEQLPAFRLAAGAEDRQDVGAAVSFRQLLQTRMASVPLDIASPSGAPIRADQEPTAPVRVDQEPSASAMTSSPFSSSEPVRILKWGVAGVTGYVVRGAGS